MGKKKAESVGTLDEVLNSWSEAMKKKLSTESASSDVSFKVHPNSFAALQSDFKVQPAGKAVVLSDYEDQEPEVVGCAYCADSGYGDYCGYGDWSEPNPDCGFAPEDEEEDYYNPNGCAWCCHTDDDCGWGDPDSYNEDCGYAGEGPTPAHSGCLACKELAPHNKCYHMFAATGANPHCTYYTKWLEKHLDEVATEWLGCEACTDPGADAMPRPIEAYKCTPELNEKPRTCALWLWHEDNLKRVKMEKVGRGRGRWNRFVANAWCGDGVLSQDYSPFGHRHTQAAKEVGLTLGMDLAKECADFYVLERLATDLQNKDHHDDTRYDASVFYPVGWESDTRVERFSWHVWRSFTDLERRLANEFARYFSMACGGELRHGSAGLLQVFKDEIVCAHSHKSSCYQGHIKPWYCRHTCEGKVRCRPTNRLLDENEPAARLYKEYVDFLLSQGGNRAVAWRQFLRLIDDNKPHWARLMEILAMAFNSERIFGHGSSVGGPRWGAGAQLVADYVGGSIKARTFIDRCWSYQHNGGSFFNKVYFLVPIKDANGLYYSQAAENEAYYQTPEGQTGIVGDTLTYVLVAQHRDKYDDIAQNFCSPGVEELWRKRGEMNA